MNKALKARRTRTVRVVGAVVCAVFGLSFCWNQYASVAWAADGNVYVSPNYTVMDKLKFVQKGTDIVREPSLIFPFDSSNTDVKLDKLLPVTSPGSDIMAHMLRYETSGDIKVVKTAAYFSDKTQADYFMIKDATDTRSGNVSACRAIGAYVFDHETEAGRQVDFFGNNKKDNAFDQQKDPSKELAFITVTIRYTTDPLFPKNKSYSYMIGRNNICVKPNDVDDTEYDSSVSNSPGISGDESGATRNGKKFFGNYVIPSDFRENALPEADTGGLYKLEITVEYSHTKKMTHAPGASGDKEANQQQVRFRMAVPRCGADDTTCRRYIAPVSVDPDGGTKDLTDQNYSTIRGPIGGLNKFYLTMRYEFGLPCTAAVPQKKWISIYDVDNRTDWDDPDPDGAGILTGSTDSTNTTGLDQNLTGIYIEQSVDGGLNWDRVPKVNSTGDGITATRGGFWISSGNADYNTHSWVWDNGAAQLGSLASSITDGLELVMHPGTRYRVVVTPSHSTNLLGVGLPTDSIYGMINCQPKVQGSITANPSDSVEDTQNIDFTFASQKDTTSFYSKSSDYTYTTRVWYETSSNVVTPTLDAGETEVASCAKTGVPHTHPGSTEWNLIAVCPVTVDLPDPPKPPAVSICASLELVATDGTIIKNKTTIRCVYIGKYPGLTVQNGDLRVGGSFPTAASACRLPHDYNAASWQSYSVRMHAYSLPGRSSLGQYAAVTPGYVYKYGSQGIPLSSGEESTRLLFGTGGFDSYPVDDHGFYLGDPASVTLTAAATTSYCLPDVNRLYAVSIPATNIAANQSLPDVNALPAESSYNFTDSNKEIAISTAAGSTLGTGKRVIIRVTQNTGVSHNVIRIKGPILYPQTGYTALSQIPQFIVIADDNIDIQFDHAQDNVDMTVNGIYSTKGNIYTCGSIYGNMAPAESNSVTTMCNNAKLIVKGAVITAKQVLPFRSAGFNNNETNSYAETFDLSLETLLGDYTRARTQKVLSTDYQSELPPRL